MLFNSFEYFGFLAVVLLLYYLSRRRETQNIILLIASYVFYSLWDYRFLSLILITTALNYVAARQIKRAESKRTARFWLLLSLVVGLGMLGVFKYFNFFAEGFTALLNGFGLQVNFATLNIVLPVGISFFTFQTLSYTIDVFRGKSQPENNLLDFALYVAFFPVVLAGPIERSTTLLPQIQKDREVTKESLQEGLLLIAIGLFRKIAIADVATAVVDSYFAAPEEYSTIGLLMGLYLLALQIYGDFSGYSNIARGTARLMGFKLIVNFRRPYFSQGFIEFWTRWHISLSQWIRDYIFFPLARALRQWSQGKYPRLIELLVYLIVMGLVGLWHGAAWTFVVWGLLHGVYQALERVFQMNRGRRPRRERNWRDYVFGGLSMFLVFHVVTLTWVFFRAPDFASAQVYLTQLFSFSLPETRLIQELARAVFPVGILGVLLLLIDIPQEVTKDEFFLIRSPVVLRLGYAVLIALAIVFIGGYGGAPFIYFQF